MGVAGPSIGAGQQAHWPEKQRERGAVHRERYRALAACAGFSVTGGRGVLGSQRGLTHKASHIQGTGQQVT